MAASITPPVIFILQVLEEKSRRMTSQDFGPVHYLFNNHTLTSYGVALETYTRSCH